MKFRKKPITISAEQWFPGSKIEGVVYDGGEDHRGMIVTLEGAMIVMPGDWIVVGIKGERYAVKPDIFEATYEKAE